MTRGEPLDVLAEARRLAGLHLERAGITKSAGSGGVRDELALSLYVPVVEALHDAFGTGPRLGIDGQLVTKSAGPGGDAGDVAAAMARNRKAARKLRKSFERLEAGERQRQEDAAERQAAIAEKMAGRPARPQFRDISPADVHRLRLVMSKIAEVDAEFAARLQQEHGTGGPAGGGGA